MSAPRSPARSQFSPHARGSVWAGRWFLEGFFFPYCWWLLPSLQLIPLASPQLIPRESSQTLAKLLTTSRSLGLGKHKTLRDLGVLGLSEQGGAGGDGRAGRFHSLGCRRLCGGRHSLSLGLTGQDQGEGVEEATNPLRSKAVIPLQMN